MKENLLRAITLFSILATTVTMIGCGPKTIATPYVAEEFVVCNASGNQIFPRISGDIVVWTDYRNGNGDIFGYDLGSGAEFAICTDENDQGGPSIDNDIVVWTDARNDDDDTSRSDIYGYNLSTEYEFIICAEPYNQGAPSISGDSVVWIDEGIDDDYNSSIYAYKFSAGEIFPISTYQSMKLFPSIHGDLVAWLDFRKVDFSTLNQQPQPVLNTEIYCYDLSSALEFAVTDDEIMQDPPGADIYGDLMVWSECDYSEGVCGIYSYDLITHTKSALSTSRDAINAPAIYGDIVVWADFRNDNGDIYGYNLKTGEEFAICTDSGQQQSPAIYGNIVIWSDDREELANTYDIYGARLTFDNQ